MLARLAFMKMLIVNRARVQSRRQKHHWANESSRGTNDCADLESKQAGAPDHLKVFAMRRCGIKVRGSEAEGMAFEYEVMAPPARDGLLLPNVFQPARNQRPSCSVVLQSLFSASGVALGGP
jgi:hypothetical protein